jgi:hypothetical protein
MGDFGFKSGIETSGKVMKSLGFTHIKVRAVDTFFCRSIHLLAGDFLLQKQCSLTAEERDGLS